MKGKDTRARGTQAGRRVPPADSNASHLRDRWVTEQEGSVVTGMSVPWFQRKRWEGGGPPYTKLGRAVRYKLSDLVAWMEERRRHSTSDRTHQDNEGTSLPASEENTTPTTGAEGLRRPAGTARPESSPGHRPSPQGDT
jgi:predicted DNA-binding transcriptional regulator AlpA